MVFAHRIDRIDHEIFAQDGRVVHSALAFSIFHRAPTSKKFSSVGTDNPDAPNNEYAL